MIEISSDLPIIVEISGRSACGKITEICCLGRLYCKLCQLRRGGSRGICRIFIL